MLVVAPCSHAAARHAVENWHYSKVMPIGKLVRFGVWENDRFVGAVVFGRGASPYLGRALELDATEVCELVRVALRDHEAPVSQIVAQAIRGLRDTNPGLRAIVSFADPVQGHHGGIYQAGNWVYTGQSGSVTEYFVGGRWRHKKSVWYDLVQAGRQGKNLPVVPGGKPVRWRDAPGKHRYVFPLDRAMRRRVCKLAQKYPQADEGSTVSRGLPKAEVQVRPLASASTREEA